MSLNSIYLAGGVAALLLFGACTKQVKNDAQDLSVARASTEEAAPDPNGLRLHQFLRANGPALERFDVVMQEGVTVRTKSGKTYNIGRNALVKPDGSPATGTITLYIKEVSNAAGMIFADKPTATSAGQPLESFGEFYVAAKQGSVDLKLRPDSGVRVQAPAPKVNADRIPMWNGDTTITMDLSGYNYVNQLITVSTTVSANKGVDWTQVTNPASAFALFNGSNGTLNFRLDSLMTWVNCDRLMSNPNPKTTVLGYFASNYNPATGTSYVGEEPTMLFFKPAGINSVIKFYNTIFTPPAGFEGFLSYQNSIPIGQAGTFLAISSIGGQFYAEQKDVVIPAPPAGQNYTTFTFNPAPVTSAQLIALITSMNTK
ncbi:hypothetical protein SAMN05444266_10346 [Chitinophaga jiangningensis]|uniref:Uncharacterized protein n=1 Tax=Chitinophaga jiangningensis TaxID=1419482 RepID=A0A1M6ZXR4_9BACT|nr:hypothetical protein [Chitinophaga jiangningensis]SHL35206.1 hypothetical protein SAMN05444266_10346 [Chitinophaga jiangningensis]